MTIIMPRLHHGAIKTNAQSFAERGDPWDARVSKAHGLTREPSVMVEEEEYSWVEVGPNPHVKPNPYMPAPRVDLASARRSLNQRLARAKAPTFRHEVRAAPVPPPAPRTVQYVEPVEVEDHVEVTHPVCSRKAHAQWIEQERIENAARRARHLAARQRADGVCPDAA